MYKGQLWCRSRKQCECGHGCYVVGVDVDVVIVWWVWVCLVLLRPKVPRSKIAAGHVGLAVRWASEISGSFVCRGMAYKHVGKVFTLHLALIGT